MATMAEKQAAIKKRLTAKRSTQRAIEARQNMPRKTGMMHDAAVGFGMSRMNDTVKDIKDMAAISGHSRPALEAPVIHPVSKDVASNVPVNIPQTQAGIGNVQPQAFNDFRPLGDGYKEDFSQYYPAGASHPIYTNLGKSALQTELDKRGGLNYVKSGGNSRYINDAPIDKDKLAMLKNIGLVTKGKMNPQKQAAPAAAPVPIVGSRRLDTPIDMKPGHYVVGNSNGGGMYGALMKYKQGLREDNQTRSDDRFNREMDVEEANSLSDTAYKNEMTSWYGQDRKAKIDLATATALEKKSRAANWDVRTSGIPALEASKIGLNDANARKANAQAVEIPFDSNSKRMLEAAMAGNQNAMAELRKVKTDSWPEQAKVMIAKLKAQADAETIQNQMFSNIAQ